MFFWCGHATKSHGCVTLYSRLFSTSPCRHIHENELLRAEQDPAADCGLHDDSDAFLRELRELHCEYHEAREEVLLLPASSRRCNLAWHLPRLAFDGNQMTDNERLERMAFVRWMKKEHHGVSVVRYGKPAQDQYIVAAVQEAWQGWWACSRRRNRRIK